MNSFGYFPICGGTALPAAPIQTRPPAPAGCYPLSPPAPPPQHPHGGGGRRNRRGGGRRRLQQQWAQDAGGASHYQQAFPAGHQAFISAPFQPTGAGYGALLAPPPLGGYGPPVPAPSYRGFPSPPVPVPWDPTLLAAQHSAPSPSSSVIGGDWYMDSGATAHMAAHPGSSGFGPFGAGPRAPFMERCAAAAPGGPPARRPLPPPPGFATPSPEVESERAPGSPSPSYEVEPGTSADAATVAAPAAAPGAAAAAPAGPAAPPLGMTTRARAGVLQPSTRYSADEYACAASTSTPSPVPTSACAALRDPHWLAAMQEEFDALQRNRTWQLIPRPPRANIISGKWVFHLSTLGTSTQTHCLLPLLNWLRSKPIHARK
nr:vegetative cell wall protein gp1-like [Aegilops tauschii subsp. strangulata]